MNWFQVTTPSKTTWPVDDELTLVHIGPDTNDENYRAAKFDYGRRVWFCSATNAMLRNVSHWATIEPVRWSLNPNKIALMTASTHETK